MDERGLWGERLMAEPKVSVVIPTYNHAHYVTMAVESVLRQDYGNLEVLVIDDGSTDETQQKLRPYFSRIRYFYKKNGGTPNALNYGLARAEGEYICWLSADDLFLGRKISKQVELMARHPEMGFSYTAFTVIDGNGVQQYAVDSPYYPEKKDLVRQLAKGCFINGSSVMMRRVAMEKVGFFDEGLPQAHDYDLWVRFLRHYDCGYLRDYLLAYRWHGENMSRNPDYECIRIVQERMKALFPQWLS